jgi:hypothetical protein
LPTGAGASTAQPGWVTILSDDGDDVFLQQIATSPYDLLYANNSSFLPTPGSSGVVRNIEQYRTLYITNGSPTDVVGLRNVGYPAASANITDFVLGLEEIVDLRGEPGTGIAAAVTLTDSGNPSNTTTWYFTAPTGGGGTASTALAGAPPVSSPFLASAGGTGTGNEALRPIRVEVVGAPDGAPDTVGDNLKGRASITWSGPIPAGYVVSLSIRYGHQDGTFLDGTASAADFGLSASSGVAPEFVLPIGGPRYGIVRGTLSGTINVAGNAIPFTTDGLGGTAVGGGSNLRFGGRLFSIFGDRGDPRLVSGTVNWDTGVVTLSFSGLDFFSIAIASNLGPQDCGPVTIDADYAYHIKGDPADPMDATFFAGLDVSREVVVDLTTSGATASIDSPIRNAQSSAAAAAVVGVGAEVGQVIGFSLLSGGSGYTTAPAVTITGGGGSGAAATAVIDASGTVIDFIITTPGTGYTSPPLVTIAPPTTAPLVGADVVLNATNVRINAQVQSADRLDVGLPGIDRFFGAAGNLAASRGIERLRQAMATATMAPAAGPGPFSVASIALIEGMAPATQPGALRR